MLGACKLICVVRRQRVENVEGISCEAKWNEGSADKKVVWGITNVWDGNFVDDFGMEVVCVGEWKGEE